MGRKYTKTKLVFGWGINDVDYNVTRYEIVNGKQERVWICPYYKRWKNILKRSICPRFKIIHPTYKGCTVTEDWKRLSNFIKWVDSQPNRDWENCVLDKDILFIGNKHYSPETCVFVNHAVNSFITDSGKTRGEYMIGVCDSGMYPKGRPYMARCSTPLGKQKKIGCYPTEIEAHIAWQSRKHELACLLAKEQPDPRVAEALRTRYAPDKDWTKA